MKGWKTLIFALGIAVAGVLQTFDWATIVPQDKTWSGMVMVAIGAAIAALRVITSTPVGKAVALWIVLPTGSLIIMLFGQPAQAADLKLAPVYKAPVSQGCIITSCSGFYAGFNVVNGGGNFDIVGSGLSGLAANGIMLGAQGGYQLWNGQWFAAAEIDAEYDVGTNMQSVGSGNQSRYAIGGLVKLGYGLANLFGAGVSGTATPVLPASLTSALVSPYVIVGVWDRPWGAGLATGAGVQALIATSWTIDLEYLHVNFNNAQVNPIVSEQTENLFKLALSKHF